MSAVPVAPYLERIGYAGWPRPDLSTLAALQRAHLASVPFENLDVYYRRGVELGESWALDKVVERRRGGWCFELNTAFAALLRAVGFDVEYRAARVMLDGDAPATPDHLTLSVSIDDQRWLVDVGFGDSFCRPLCLDTDAAQDGESRSYRLRSDADGVVLDADGDDGWQPQYRFADTETDLAVFEPASQRLQHTEGLHWTQTRFATRLWAGGRVTLLHDRLKFVGAEETLEEPVDELRWHRELEHWFGFVGFDPVDR